MSETSAANTPAPTAEEIEVVIKELEAYRERIVNENLEAAKKVKMSKPKVMANLDKNPELSRIDQALKELRSQQPT
ncbi:MAG: acetyltransferase [Microcoleaceae cyanobacterium MO_207.B10]|nr:acetyltransferase [Microcoleaceae cyanobacterium MO_207.B10]